VSLSARARRMGRRRSQLQHCPQQAVGTPEPSSRPAMEPMPGAGRHNPGDSSIARYSGKMDCALRRRNCRLACGARTGLFPTHALMTSRPQAWSLLSREVGGLTSRPIVDSPSWHRAASWWRMPSEREPPAQRCRTRRRRRRARRAVLLPSERPVWVPLRGCGGILAPQSPGGQPPAPRVENRRLRAPSPVPRPCRRPRRRATQRRPGKVGANVCRTVSRLDKNPLHRHVQLRRIRGEAECILFINTPGLPEAVQITVE
jgi:hypothetical protein